MHAPSTTPVFILCGGLGTRIKEETGFRPKPMVPIGDHPILWHIMQWYSHHGFNRFVLCAGFRSHVIKSYFLDYASMNSDFTIDVKTNQVTVHSIDHEQRWSVTVADTGVPTMTGARIARAAEKYLGDAPNFAVTYGDGLTDADLAAELAFHVGHGGVGTVLGVNPPSRFGELKLAGDRVVEFEEKPEFRDKWINGGYFFFSRRVLSYLSAAEGCVLEREPLARLADEGLLHVFRHPGFWGCMDTQRDRDKLNEMWTRGEAPWKP